MFPPPEDASLPPVKIDSEEFSPLERTLLLKAAHNSIAAWLDRRQIPTDPPNAHLAEPRGAFTTLNHRGNLRGCVGHVSARSSLYQTVIETARGAAFEDTRFWPVVREELAELKVSLSVLSSLKPVSPQEIEIGKHGLIISLAGRRGLLLPQVPVEREWDRIQFLQQTSIKAGLPPNAWERGATIEAFTAESFGDEGKIQARK